MKKIFTFLCLLLIPNIVQAQVYYSKYSDFSDYSLNYIESTDTVSVEKKLFYKEYIETSRYEYLSYSSDGTKTGNRIVEETGWLKEKPKEYDELIECNGYAFFQYRNETYISIINKNESFEIKNFRIYDKYTDETIVLIGSFPFSNKDKLTIQVNGNFNFSNLSFYFEIDNKDSKMIEFDMLKENEYDMFDLGGVFYTFSSNDKVVKEYIFPEFEDTNYFSSNPAYTICGDEIYGELIQIDKWYKSIQTLYEYIIVDKEYLGTYSDGITSLYMIDYNNPVYMYRYRIRDIVEIKDILFIDDKNTRLEDFIIYTTTEDIKITSDINYSLNGKYTVNYILPFTTVKKEVTVNIDENIINLLKTQNEYIKDLEEKVIDAVYKVDNKNLELKEALQNSGGNEKDLIDRLSVCEYDLKELSNNKKDLTGVGKIYKQSISPIIVSIFFLILLLIMYICQKKSIEKND